MFGQSLPYIQNRIKYYVYIFFTYFGYGSKADILVGFKRWFCGGCIEAFWASM